MDIRHPDRILPLTSAQNVRDLGGYATLDGQRTQWRRFVRSGDMDRMSEADQASLLDYGVTLVIDLRMEKEIVVAPNVFSGSGRVNFVVHDFWGRRFDHYRSRRKDVSHAVKLADLYCSGLEESGFVMRDIMQTIAGAPPGVAFHCRSGKDRTGLVAALLLSLAGVPTGTVCADFALTAELLKSPDADAQIDPNQPGYYLRGCEPETMALTLDFLAREYGGVAAYLQQQGVSASEIQEIRSRLLD